MQCFKYSLLSSKSLLFGAGYYVAMAVHIVHNIVHLLALNEQLQALVLCANQ